MKVSVYCRARTTSVAEPQGERGDARRIDWHEPLQLFTVRNPEALLCLELRNSLVRRDSLPSERLAAVTFQRIGAVRSAPYDVSQEP